MAHRSLNGQAFLKVRRAFLWFLDAEVRIDESNYSLLGIEMPSRTNNSGDGYSIPRCFCISSSGTPLVSGIILSTQISWSTIMVQ